MKDNNIIKDQSSKENNKPASFKSLINVLRPIREWLKSSPSITQLDNHNHHHSSNGRASVAGSTGSSSTNTNNLKGSSVTINGSARSASIVHNNTMLGNGTVEYNTHLMQRQQQQQQMNLLQQQQFHYQQQQQQHLLHQQQNQQQRRNEQQSLYSNGEQNQSQNIYSQPIYRRNQLTGSPVEAEHFKRTSKSRMSLPIMQQNILRRQAYSMLQQRGPLQPPQSLGHIYLQYQGETKRANLADELTTVDTIRALFVCAFPNLLTMEYMSQSHVKIYIYNPNCNIFYELRDIEDVKHESVLRIHQVDQILTSQHQQYQTIALQQQQALQHAPPSSITQPQYNTMMRLTPHHQIQQHYSQVNQTLQIPPAPPQAPPPKPRRMIPVVNGGNLHNPNLIYGMTTSSPLNNLQ